MSQLREAVASSPSPGPSQRTAGRGRPQQLCSWTIETERVRWTPGCPSAQRARHPLSLTLFVTWCLRSPGCNLEPVLFPSARGLCPPASLIHSGAWERWQFSGSLPRSARTRFPPWGRSAPFHLAALGTCPPPALAWTVGASASAPAAGGGYGVAFGSLSALVIQRALPPVQCSGQGSGWHGSSTPTCSDEGEEAPRGNGPGIRPPSWELASAIRR